MKKNQESKQIAVSDNSYKFNPLSHGFESIKNYPELGFNWCNTSESLFVKIVCYDDFGDLVYWYKIVRTDIGLPSDERIEISCGSYDFRKPCEYGKQSNAKIEYLGLISNDEFAESLLKHLLGTTTNDSLKNCSIRRYSDNIGVKMRSEFPQHYNYMVNS